MQRFGRQTMRIDGQPQAQSSALEAAVMAWGMRVEGMGLSGRLGRARTLGAVNQVRVNGSGKWRRKRKHSGPWTRPSCSRIPVLAEAEMARRRWRGLRRRIAMDGRR